MQQVYTLSTAAYREAERATAAAAQARDLREQTAKLASSASGDVAAALTAFDKKVEAVAGAPGGGRGATAGQGRGGAMPAAAAGRGAAAAPGTGRGATAGDATLTGAAARLGSVMNLLQAADVPPTAVQLEAIANARAAGTSAMARWSAIKTVDVPALNAKLKTAGIEALTIR
jgi:hypothetical protein